MDLAELQLVIRSEQVAPATAGLDKLASSATVAEKATEKLTLATQREQAALAVATKATSAFNVQLLAASAHSSASAASQTLLLSNLKAVEAQAASTSKGFFSLTGVLGKLGAAFGIALGGRIIVQGIANLIDTADRMRDLSIVAGTTVETMSELAFVASQTGTSTESLSTGLRFLNRNLAEFLTTGKGTGAEGFTRLGLSMAEIKKSGESVVDLLPKIGAGLRSLSDEERVLVLSKIAGRSGPELLQFFLSDIAEGRKEAVQAGAVINTEAAEAADNFNDSMTKLKATLTALAVNTMPPFLDALRGIVELVSSPSKLIEPFLQQGSGMDVRPRQYEDEFGNRVTIPRTPAEQEDWQKTLQELGQRMAKEDEEKARIASEKLLDAQRAKFGVEPGFQGPLPEFAPSPDDLDRIKASREAMSELIVALKDEIEFVGMSNEERRDAIDLRKLEEAAMEANLDGSDLMVEQYKEELKALRELQKTEKERAQAMEDFARLREDVANIQRGLDTRLAAATMDKDERSVFLQGQAFRQRLEASGRLSPEEIDDSTKAFEEQIRVIERLERAYAGMESASREFAAGLADVAFEGKDAKDALEDFLRSLGSRALQNAVQQLVMALAGPALQKIGGQPGTGSVAVGILGSLLAARGMAIHQGQVIPFALGGLPDIVERPTLFPMSGGRTGAAGEAGEEAIMPLKRDPRTGRLGVEAGRGGRNTTLIQNIKTNDADSFRRSKRQILSDARDFLR